MIYSDILRDYSERVCYGRYPYSKAKIWLVQHCVAISATAKLLLS